MERYDLRTQSAYLFELDIKRLMIYSIIRYFEEKGFQWKGLLTLWAKMIGLATLGVGMNSFFLRVAWMYL